MHATAIKPALAQTKTLIFPVVLSLTMHAVVWLSACFVGMACT